MARLGAAERVRERGRVSDHDREPFAILCRVASSTPPRSYTYSN